MKGVIRKAVKRWGEKKNHQMVKKVPADADQKITAKKSEQPVLVDEAVQVQLQEVPAASKQITNELMVLQEEFHEQLKVTTNMFSLDGGRESESDNSDSDSETDDE